MRVMLPKIRRFYQLARQFSPAEFALAKNARRCRPLQCPGGSVEVAEGKSCSKGSALPRACRNCGHVKRPADGTVIHQELVMG